MQSLKQILDKYIEKDLGIPRLSDEMGIMSAWNSLGLEIPCNVATPDKLVSGILYVNVKNSVWAQQLNMQKTKIMEKINGRLGKTTIKDMKTKIGETARPKVNEPVQEPEICGRCGVEFIGDGKKCSACGREEKSARITSLYRMVRKDEKLTYAQAKNLLGAISQDEFRRAKRDISANKRDDIERKGKRRGKKTN